MAVLVTVPLTPATSAAYEGPPEGYAPYQPQRTCRDEARRGTRELAAWLDRRFHGGRPVASVRGCRSGGTSEHKDGRAIDWPMDARSKADRQEVRRFLERLLRTDRQGNPHARARRMGVMYVIWNDRMWASYDRFARKDYSASVACKAAGSCSRTLRHRDHVHISLSRRGARALTSWYTER